MLIAYIDDSGGRDTKYVTLAGHATTEEKWKAFEVHARLFFDEIGLDYLHTEDFRHARGFWSDKDWDYRKGFANVFCEILEMYVADSFEFSTLRKIYPKRKKELGRNKTVSPLGFCMVGIIDQYQKVGHLDLIAQHGETLSFVVEDGNSNNADVLARFQHAKQHHAMLGTLSFAEKKSVISLQAADFVAYYSRRIRGMDPKAKRFPDEYRLFAEATQRLAIRHFGATDFGG
ncbi:MAG: DUF3800 domain-containing protein [Ruegeria sp.]|uniref:DUF3800 domain-containing protein n=1 Tax=Ruegeria sp. TaxID=1879320 RepID=UPI00349EB80F